MKLYNLEETILKIAKAVPDIRTVHKGDVYYYNERENVEYSAFNILMREVFEYRSDYYTIFHVNLFAFDRLTESKDNLSDCESHAIQQLKAILNKLEDLGATIDSVAYYPFTQRFNDLCAGAYADVRIRVETNDCGDYYFEVDDNIELYNIVITENGTYTAPTNTAYKTVTVNVEGGSPDLKYYSEDNDGTNAIINVRNNKITVASDGIEIADKDDKGRIIVDIDGVGVYTGSDAGFTLNDARVLTSNDLDDINTEISEIKSDIPTFPTIIDAENQMVSVNDLPSYIARTVNYEDRTYTLVGAFYYSNEQGNIPDVNFFASVINSGYPYSEKRFLTVYGLDGVKVDPVGFTPTGPNNNFKTWSKHFYSPIFGMWILVYFDRSSGMLNELVITTDND